MNPNFVYTGMDVSKNRLDLCIKIDRHLENKSFENNQKGHIQMIQWLKTKPQTQVICEASGGYEATSVRALQQAQIAVSIVNPLRVRFFAKSDGLLAKTDALDAALLARFGESKKPSPTLALSKNQQLLKDLMARREQLKAICTEENNRLAQTTQPLLKRQLTSHINHLQKQLKQIEDELNKLLETDQSLQQKVHSMTQIKGVGKITALSLLATVPELGTVNRQQVAALVGVAPYNDDSGSVMGLRRIQGGRVAARNALYMSALVAAFKNPTFKTFYAHLRSNGKAPKIAITAVMRKLLITLNSRLANASQALL
jgi:transposase